MTVPVAVHNGEYIFRCPFDGRQIVCTVLEAKTECLHEFALVKRGGVVVAEFEGK